MTLSELIERVTAATGPDREIDAALDDMLCAQKMGWVVEKARKLRDQNSDYANIARYTSSLDAVVALVKREFPGWSWIAGEFPKVQAQLAQPVQTEFGDGIGIRAQVYGEAATPALALLLAFLRARETT